MSRSNNRSYNQHIQSRIPISPVPPLPTTKRSNDVAPKPVTRGIKPVVTTTRRAAVQRRPVPAKKAASSIKTKRGPSSSTSTPFYQPLLSMWNSAVGGNNRGGAQKKPIAKKTSTSSSQAKAKQVRGGNASGTVKKRVVQTNRQGMMMASDGALLRRENADEDEVLVNRREYDEMERRQIVLGTDENGEPVVEDASGRTVIVKQDNYGDEQVEVLDDNADVVDEHVVIDTDEEGREHVRKIIIDESDGNVEEIDETNDLILDEEEIEEDDEEIIEEEGGEDAIIEEEDEQFIEEEEEEEEEEEDEFEEEDEVTMGNKGCCGAMVTMTYFHGRRVCKMGFGMYRFARKNIGRVHHLLMMPFVMCPILFVVFPFLLSLGMFGVWHTEIRARYEELMLPPYVSLPAMICDLVWPVCYISMGYAAFLVARHPRGIMCGPVYCALKWWFIQLFMTLLWAPTFNSKMLDMTTVMTVGLSISVFITYCKFCYVNRRAARIMRCYWFFTVYSCVLSFAIWMMNDPRKFMSLMDRFVDAKNMMTMEVDESTS